MAELPADDDLVTWLSLMQHYGTPTRLIDFTNSFYVACYFALSGAKSDAAIWSIDPFLGFDVVREVFGATLSGMRDDWDDYSTKCGNDHLNSILKSASTASSEESPRGVVAVEPFFRHTRISIQQGIFMMPLDISSSFMDNIEPFFRPDKTQLRKIILKEKVVHTGLAHLRAMNITSETLFPGVDGFAKSLVHKYMDIN